MSPVKVQQSSGEPPLPVRRTDRNRISPGRTRPWDRLKRGEPEAPARWSGAAAIASLAAWVVYAGTFAGVFVLSGFSAGMAIRGAIANALPDGLLALAAIGTTRRVAWPGMGRGRFPLAHAAIALVLAALAATTKTLLLWADVALFRAGAPFRLNGAILTWQVFISLLIYVAVAGAFYAQANARSLRQAAEAAERAEMLRARAELSALRAQLNPHFLFNVLHSVLGLVRRDPALAEQALERLGDLLRYALHVHRDGVDWTTLRREWEFMESYLDLERIRLGERLRVSLEADPAAFDRPVPTFLLQPLVENAVRHGIAPRAAGGSLRVSASLDGTSLRLEVDNDGAINDGAIDERTGIAGGSHQAAHAGERAHRDGRPGDFPFRGGAIVSAGGPSGVASGPGRGSTHEGHGKIGGGPGPDSTEECRPGPVRTRSREAPGLGLRLLRERLEALFGGRAVMSFGPKPEGGYRVVLTLPEGVLATDPGNSDLLRDEVVGGNRVGDERSGLGPGADE